MNIPPYETQYSASTHTDAEDCVPESLCHLIYSYTLFRGSPRALAWLMERDGKLTPNGSSIEDAVAYVNKYGLVPYNLWPTPDSFTWDSYYTPVPQEILDQAIPVKVEIIPFNNEYPYWTQLSFPTPTGSLFHWVMRINDTQYFDSEAGAPIKLLNYENAVVLSQHSLKITLMSNSIFVQKAGTEEFGFYLPATTVESLKDKALNLGLEQIIKADGTVDFSQAKQINGL